MKGSKKRAMQMVWSCGYAVLPLLLTVGMVDESNAQTFTLNNGNSVLQINASSLAGMTSYTVDGVSQAAQQWFYYRIGNSGSEKPIETISLGTPSFANPSDARSLDLTYSNSLYSARVVYQLTGGSAGSGQSSLNETVTFLNKSTTSTLDLRFFDYSDFDLNGVPGGQSLQFTTTSIPTLRTNSFTQTLGVSTLTSRLISGADTLSHVQAALFPTILTSLNDGNPTTLNDAMSSGPGDVTGAFEWEVTLAANGTLSISKLISMQGLVVPEPSALALLTLGFLLLPRHRRS
jgi:hypothetical protein